MAELEVIDLDEEEYEFAINNMINYGGESVITLGRARNTAFKLFDNRYLVDPKISARKETKIRVLAEQDDIPFFPSVISLVTYHDVFIGYELSYDKKNKSLDIMQDYLSREEMIKVLKKLKEQLLYLHGHPLSIVFGDLREVNILVNSDSLEVGLCDIDNTSILGMDFETMGSLQGRFMLKNKGRITPRLDMYMHNYLTNDLIFGPNYINDRIVKMYTNTRPKGYLIDEL